jgi:predicted nucleotidyltransferase
MTADTIPAEARAEILKRLRAAEEEHDVRVLLAVESGSRAWGFASPDSDFDARFIYVHRRDWYVAVGLEEQRDVIEYPIVDELDVNGWDLRKALRLYWKSNPAFVEWIQSPIVYREQGRFAARARTLLPEIYSRERGIHHYRSMARTAFREHLQGPRVQHKKYLYALRALLSVRWLERHHGAAPIEFGRLLAMTDDPQLLADIDALLVRKRASAEKDLAEPIATIHEFIVAELDRLHAFIPPPMRPGELLPALNTLFRELVAEAWDGTDDV